MFTSTYHSQSFSQDSTKGYPRFRSREKEKNNLIGLIRSKDNPVALQVSESGIRQTHLQTASYEEFYYIIKLLIIGTMHLKKNNKSGTYSEAIIINNRNKFEY